MSSIRDRITKKCHSDPRVTIDTIHSNIISELNTEEKSSYYLENGLLLDKYYSKPVDGEAQTKTVGNNVLSYFQTKEEEEDCSQEVEDNIY